jgi:hypothetical protein
MIKSMKHVRGFLAIVFVLACVSVPTVTASAHSTVVDGGKITVHARIAATHYIIVDEHDKIIQIDSNTTDVATPRIFLQKVKSGNERVMTPTVYSPVSTHCPKWRHPYWHHIQGKFRPNTRCARPPLPPPTACASASVIAGNVQQVKYFTAMI